MKRLLTIAAAAIAAGLFAPAFGQVSTLSRIVDCSGDPAPINHELLRGETVVLEYLYRQTNADFAVAAATNVALCYRSPDMAAGTFYQVAGTVTGNAARFTWSPAAQTAATNFTYTVVLAGVTGANMRAFGSIKQRGTVTGTASNVPVAFVPVAWSDAIAVLRTALVFNASTTDLVARAGVESLQAGALELTNAAAAASNAIAAVQASTSRWESAWIAGTNWLASAAATITGAMVANWNTAYTAATNWTASVAARITADETNQWTRATSPAQVTQIVQTATSGMITQGQNNASVGTNWTASDVHTESIAPVGTAFPRLGMSQGTAFDGDGMDSIDWDSRFLYDANGNLVINWKNLGLFDTNDVERLNWQNGTLSGSWSLNGSGIVTNTDPVYAAAVTNATGGILTITGRAIGLVYSSLTNAIGQTYAAFSHSHAWAAVTNAPTTAAGYGLTDVVTNYAPYPLEVSTITNTGSVTITNIMGHAYNRTFTSTGTITYVFAGTNDASTVQECYFVSVATGLPARVYPGAPMFVYGGAFTNAAPPSTAWLAAIVSHDALTYRIYCETNGTAGMGTP